MSDVGPSRRGIVFDPTINLGHVLTALAFLASTVAGWVTLNNRVEQQAREIARVEEKSDKATVRVETVLMDKINSNRAQADQLQIRTAEDIREVKQLIRDGFRDLDVKLERKADKPGR